MKRGLLILLCLLLVLAACKSETQDAADSFAVYYATREPYRDGKAIDCEQDTISQTGEPVDELMALLLKDPDSDKLVSPLPSGVSLLDWSLQDGVLSLTFSEGYGRLSGIDLTIADYCVALTMSQLEEVRSIVITAEGDVIPSRYDQQLRSSDVILTAMDDEPVSLAADLYFPTADAAGLRAEQREILTNGATTYSMAVLTALMEGPREEGLCSLIPEGTVLLSTKVEDDVCYVNFSNGFSETTDAGTGESALLLYSVVDTMCSLGGVNMVQLLIEGEAPAFFGGVSTSAPLKPDFSLVRKD